MAKEGVLYGVKVLQTLVGLVTLAIATLTIQPMLKRAPKVARFHPNLKIILMCGSTLYVIHSVFLVAEHFLDAFIFHINTEDPCFYLIVTWKCLM